MRYVDCKVVLFALLFALAGWMVFGGPKAEAQDLSEDVDEVFAEWDRPDSPGCAVGVYEEGEIVYEAGYGIANLDHDVPITPETVFYIGSVSKQLTTASIALLHLRGELSLDDDIREYLPEMPEYDEPITVRHLVHHTSGIRDIYALMRLKGMNPANVMTEEDVLDLVASQQTLNFEPGEEYMYSNAGYFLLAQIVKRASGQSLREYAKANIFEPIEMGDTHFHDDRGDIVPRRAMSYQQGNDGFRQSYLANFEGVGAGGLYSTIRDFVKWDRQLNEDRLGEPEFNELMLERGLLADGDTLDYAFALTHGTYKGMPTVGHGGSFMGFRADYSRFPEAGLSVAVFCNLGNINPGNVADQVADIFLEKEFESYLSRYTGTYHNTNLDVDYRITLKDGNLFLDRDHSPRGTMVYNGEDSFRVGGWTVEFMRNESEVSQLVINAGRARDVVFDRQ